MNTQQPTELVLVCAQCAARGVMRRGIRDACEYASEVHEDQSLCAQDCCADCRADCADEI